VTYGPTAAVPLRRVTSAATLLITAVTVALLAANAIPARAGLCGDDVDGKRIACRCGDIVVSDTTLRPTDPVAAARCRLDGLTLRVPEPAESITLNLGGLSVIGSSYGAGIRIERGGSDGALIVGGDGDAVGEIVGFGTGIVATRNNSARRIERVHVKGNRHEGLSLRASGVLLVDVAASQNGGTGIRLYGQGGRLLGIVAERNGDDGIYVRSRGAIVEGRVEANGGRGIVSEGYGSDISRVVSRNNDGHGAVTRGGPHATRGLVAEGNSGDQIRARSSELQP